MIRKRDIGHQGTLGVVSFFRFFPTTFRLTSGENNTVLASQGPSHSLEDLIRVPTSARVSLKPRKRHTDAPVSAGNYNARRSIDVSVPCVGSSLRRNRGGPGWCVRPPTLPFPPPPWSAYKIRRISRLSRLTCGLGLMDDFLPTPIFTSRLTRSPNDRHIPEKLSKIAVRADPGTH